MMSNFSKAGWCRMCLFSPVFSFTLISFNLSPSISGSEQHQVLRIQNSHEAAASAEGSEMYVQYFIDGISCLQFWDGWLSDTLLSCTINNP